MEELMRQNFLIFTLMHFIFQNILVVIMEGRKELIISQQTLIFFI